MRGTRYDGVMAHVGNDRQCQPDQFIDQARQQKSDFNTIRKEKGI